MGATPGAMLIYCRALRNLGLNKLGFGYRSRSGSSMCGHIESLIRLGYPRVTLHSGRPHYPMFTTGDLRGEGSARQGANLPTYAFQHSIVRGYLPGLSGGGIHRWKAHGAWGGERRGSNPQWDGYGDFTPKMQLPLWFEMAQAESPEAGFDYFLAQMRTPAQDRFIPTLYFGLEPLTASAVEPPRAPSWVALDRGLAMLRAEESPAYWESAKPAVGLRLGANYAHHVNDSFSLSGFYAFNRPIYLNRQTRRGYAFGYSRSVLSHCGVMVDGKEPAFTEHVVARRGFYPPVKFVAVSSPRLYSGVGATRALMLTDRYCVDAFRIAGEDGREHDVIWVVHALGSAEQPQPGGWRKVELSKPLSFFEEARAPVRSRAVAEATVIQRLALDDPAKAKLPPAWYDRKIGVRVTVGGGEGTELFLARTPVDDPANAKLRDPEGYFELQEVGGTSIIARRKAAQTCFVAFHLPFEGGTPPPIRAVEHPTAGDAVRVVEVIDERSGAPHDWLLLDLRGEAERRQLYAVEVPGKGQFRFANHAFVRVMGSDVDVWGDLRGLRLKAPVPEPTFRHNGRTTSASVESGQLVYQSQRR